MGSNQMTSSRNRGNQTPDLPLASWPKWRDDLILHLRRKHLAGERIGDILYEVDAHLRESGETPEEAFGAPEAYAESRAANERASAPRIDIVRQVLAPLIGGFLLGLGAFNLGAGDDDGVWFLPWLEVVTGTILYVYTFANVPVDFIKHPRTGQTLFSSRRRAIALSVALVVVEVVLLFALGWVTGR